MEPRFGKSADLLYGLMRFVIAALYACHGAQKLFGVFGGHPVPRPSLLFAAAVIEIVAGPLIAIGLFTRVAAFIASGEMAAAYFTQHAARSFWPIVNKGELAVALCFVFLFVASVGSGTFGVDRAIRRT